MENNHEKYMREAIELSIKNVDHNGGPFGAVIVKNGKIISKGTNSVTINNDPTAHAEIIAIREAASKLKTYDLRGCTIYSSCEPCPMCLAAIYWAHIDKIYYANTRKDAEKFNFDDSFIYNELKLPLKKRKIPIKQILKDEAIEAFVKWKENPDKTNY